jgi:hypothetical protein
MREGELIGTLFLVRSEQRPFSDKQIKLVETFADQAIIAIENTRLFEEVQARTRELAKTVEDLEIASQHKNQFVANMSHELRTPLAAILGYAELIQEGFYGALPEKSMDAQVEASIAPFRTAVEQVRTVPGIKSLAAQTILSEIGIDMSRFSSSGHLISWACICPRSDESAGKRRSTRIRKGSPWLKTTLVQCAWAATRKKGSYLQAQYLPHQSSPRPQEGYCCRCGFDPHGHLSHAQGRNDASRPRSQPLRCPRQGTAEEPSPQTPC